MVRQQPRGNRRSFRRLLFFVCIDFGLFVIGFCCSTSLAFLPSTRSSSSARLPYYLYNNNIAKTTEAPREDEWPPKPPDDEEEHLNMEHTMHRRALYPSTTTTSSSSNSLDRGRRDAEFLHLEPLWPSARRAARWQQEARQQAQFERDGDALWALREAAAALSGDSHQRHALLERDPEFVYRQAMEQMQTWSRQGRRQENIPAALVRKSQAARSCIPHFNYEGLWIGKYGGKHNTTTAAATEAPYDLINVTYVAGDILIATKLTRHNGHVPSGEISFQVDLRRGRPLPPIALSPAAASKWGRSKLTRFLGLGQVAEANFANRQWIPGQLIVISEHFFSFAWLNEHVEQQIFFGRPSPEMALKLLSQPVQKDDDLQVSSRNKDHVQRCLERTEEEVFDELEHNANPYGSGIWHCNDAEECYFE